ncbi:unnamed protein product [Blepharisma stoltei]|uniref:TNFR-Cys domain-containing protein n=1 Tax=Blepharisma stoltei TaxID=1481888 RepID=A0AAU9K850_9CILI|nr:unnamed protein product [Blepharisma stoltei]
MNFILIIISKAVLIWSFGPHGNYNWGIKPGHFYLKHKIDYKKANPSLFSWISQNISFSICTILSEDKLNSLEMNFSSVQDLAATNFSYSNISPLIPIPASFHAKQSLILSPNQEFYFDGASSIIENLKFKLYDYFKWVLSINPHTWEKASNSHISKSNIFSDFYNAPYHLIVLYAFLILFARKILDLAYRDAMLNFQLITIVGLITQVYCIVCGSGSFSYQNILCLSYCPTGYLQNTSTNTCDYIAHITLTLTLDNRIILDQKGTIWVGSSITNTYPTYDANDPYPAESRGYYFKSNSYIAIPVMLAPTFSIAIWLKTLSAGIVLVKPIPAYQWVVEILASGYPRLSLLMSDSSTTISVTGSSNVLNGWFFVSFDGYINTDGTTTISSYIDGSFLQSFTTATALYMQDSVSGNVYVGNDIIGFTGFIWKVRIYCLNNYYLDEWRTSGCTSPCTKCSADLSCPSDCPLDKYIDGSSCKDCKTNCNKGCISSDTCNLCLTKECATCTAFIGTESCLTCITNAVSDGNGGCTCDTYAFWVSLTQSCERCDVLCANCLKTTYFECSACSGSYQLVGNVCLNGCPYGFGGSCLPITTPVVDKSFSVDFQGSYGILTTGTSSSSFQFFNTPESVDPIPAYMRGLYFDGSTYLLSSASILLYHSFSIGLWLYVTASGDILEKQTRLILLSSGVTAIMEDPTQATASKTLSLGTTLIDWNYLSVTFAYSSGSTTITIYINNVVASTLPVSNYIYRDLASTNLMVGKSSSSGFKGFINSFQLWNAPISSFSSYINAVCGSGHACLWSCDLSHFWSGSSYISCNSCSKGCVRAANCNVCDDALCLICTGFGSGKCTQCVSNASIIGTNCQCNSGYYWNDINESCELCDISCKSCTSANWYDCLTCYSGYYMVLGICSSSCPSGYISSSTGVCVFSQEIIFDLNLNTLNGIVYDNASSIPVITGSAKQFYPDYEADDPIPAYLRGFYFNGESSILRMPEYSTYTSPKLVIAPIFTISIWLNTETSYSAIISKHDASDNYSTLYYISLIAGKPTISLLISSSAFFYMSQASLNNYEWSHIVFTLKMNSGSNIISSYVNGLFDSSVTTGYGTFNDIGSHTTMTIGAQISSSAVYNYYQGFIYTIQIFNAVKPISSLSTTSCTESCSVCPISQVCIPNCKIKEYWSGPAYNKCYSCNIKCKKSCRDWRDTCSLCDNLLCESCSDYSSCEACKENTINPGSCACDDNYVLDDTQSNTCIPIESGGFKGEDGHFHKCPNLCSSCESLTKCTACTSNASIQNDLCYCNLGYNGTESCILVSFSAKLTVLADNSLYLTFSESLAKNLTTSDFVIIIGNQEEISSKLEKMNNTCYYISLAITEKISEGTLAIIQFIDLSKVKSVSNGILNSSEISASLNSYDPESNSPVTESVSSQSQTASQTTVSVVASMSIINSSSSSLWCLMNTLQILSYMTLSGIPFSSKLRSFLNNLNSFNLFPNVFQYFIDKNKGNTPYSQAEEFGFDTDLILINQGNDFTLLLGSIAALPLILYFSRCSNRWIGNKFTKRLGDYQYAFYFRFWIQCYLELGAAACIGLTIFEFTNITQIANFALCLSLCILLIATPGVYFWFSYKNKARIETRDKAFFASFSTFFYEFRTDKGLITTQYYFLFFARRLVYIVNLVYLRDYPQTEVTVNIVLSFLTMIYLALCWPFEDQILQITNLVTEILIFLIMSSTTAYLFNFEQEVIEGIEDSIIIIVLVIIAIQTISSIIIFSKTLYQAIKEKLVKSGIVKENNNPQYNRIRKIQI